jgi:predicted nuclease of predicted toxin-antitoxin system
MARLAGDTMHGDAGSVKFKVDENLGRREPRILQTAGHDAIGIRDQGLGGVADVRVLEACAAEERSLITLDRDFGNVLRFPPRNDHGIVILAMPDRARSEILATRIREFMDVLATHSLGRDLGIVEPGRVRIHTSNDPLDPP